MIKWFTIILKLGLCKKEDHGFSTFYSEIVYIQKAEFLQFEDGNCEKLGLHVPQSSMYKYTRSFIFK